MSTLHLPPTTDPAKLKARRERWLQTHPICSVCWQVRGKVTAAIDTIRDPSVIDNVLISVCEQCKAQHVR